MGGGGGSFFFLLSQTTGRRRPPCGAGAPGEGRGAMLQMNVRLGIFKLNVVCGILPQDSINKTSTGPVFGRIGVGL